MKFITILAFTFVLMGLVFAQSVDPNAASSENPLTSTEGYGMEALQPLVKGLIDGFRVLMLQVRFVRILFENFGVEMGRIARNATTMPNSGSGLPFTLPSLPFPIPSQYAGRQEPVSETTIASQFQEIFDRWGVNTATAFRGLLSEVAHVYQDAVAALVKQGEVSRNQVVQSYNTIASAMTSISKMIQDNFPSAESIASSINNMSQSLNQNVTAILSGLVPDGLPTGLPTGIPDILPAGLPTLPSLPTFPSLQDLIPTTLQSGSSKKNN